MSRLGKHVLVDIHDADHLDDQAYIEKVLHECAQVAGATILHTDTHIFTPQNGISSLLVLMESHMSIHTWPEVGKAAFDAFMCGSADPQNCIAVLESAFRPRHLSYHVIDRCTAQLFTPKIVQETTTNGTAVCNV